MPMGDHADFRFADLPIGLGLALHGERVLVERVADSRESGPGGAGVVAVGEIIGGAAVRGPGEQDANVQALGAGVENGDQLFIAAGGVFPRVVITVHEKRDVFLPLVEFFGNLREAFSDGEQFVAELLHRSFRPVAEFVDRGAVGGEEAEVVGAIVAERAAGNVAIGDRPVFGHGRGGLRLASGEEPLLATDHAPARENFRAL
jgi:hypothetical protein